MDIAKIESFEKRIDDIIVNYATDVKKSIDASAADEEAKNLILTSASKNVTAMSAFKLEIINLLK